jgi:hypothetical protein
MYNQGPLKGAKIFLLLIVLTSFILNFSKNPLPTNLFFISLVGLIKKWDSNDKIFGKLLPGFNSAHLIPLVILFFIFVYLRKNVKNSQKGLLDSPISFLLFIALLSILNVRQGDFIVGLSGFFVFVTPIAFYFSGKLLRDEDFSKVLKSIYAISILSILYGTYQSLIRFPIWDKDWLYLARLKGYNSIFFTGNRPFSFYLSVQEYCGIINLGLFCLLCIARSESGKTLKAYQFTSIVAFFYASLSTGSRSCLCITSLLTIALMSRSFGLKWLHNRKSTIHLGILVVIILYLLPFLQPLLNNNSRVSKLFVRSTGSLISQSSNFEANTAHISVAFEGIATGLRSVFGYGVGVVTGVADYLGNGRINTENDFGNLAVAFGGFGIVVALLFYIRIFHLNRRLSEIFPNMVIQLVLLSLGNIFNAGLYSLNCYIFLLLGYFARIENSQPSSDFKIMPNRI